MTRGKFITFEGPDGSGKTTVSSAVCERLTELGYSVRYSREPGGSNIAERIRDIILDPDHTDMDPRCEALLYAASRRQHLTDIILPSLEQGTHVICDRFVDSSVAYQGFGRHIGAEPIREINAFATDGILPDKTIFLDVPAEIGLERINAGRREKDRLDQEGIAFHQAVYDGYRHVVETGGDRIVVIDASKPVDEVIENALSAVREILDGE
ncbi:MAG: dTMP kinase [Solobacterium sp.]|nr:dTMP kinase [Solobacterium sp.]